MRPALLFFLATLTLPAWAADDKKKKEDDDDIPESEAPLNEDLFKEESEETEEGQPVERLQEDDTEGTQDEPGDLDFVEPEQDENIEFNDDEDVQGDVKPRGPGEDTAELYRATTDRTRNMGPEEELLTWEQYLQKYPNSLFRERIEKRMDELSSDLFGERVPGSDQGGGSGGGGASQELGFALPMRLTPVDTRQRLSAGFEMGIPNWFGFKAEYEHQFMRQFSVSAGLKREYSGFVLHTGPRYALIKSARTGTILSGTLDLKLNASPAFLAIQPTIAVGQRIDVLSGLDLHAQFSVIPDFTNPLGMRYAGGAGAELRANEVVYAFLETSATFKYLSNDSFAPFEFMVASFGLKFVPGQKSGSTSDSQMQVGLGADAPYAWQYWGFYRGAFNGTFDWYM